MGQFGDKFRNTREKKGISLDDVSNVTKIGSRMLQAIEQEQFDQLPGGVFNRGFIRAYAKHLGLNDEEAVTDYLACLRQAQIDAQATWQPEERQAPVSRVAYTKPALQPALKPPLNPATVLPAKPAAKPAANTNTGANTTPATDTDHFRSLEAQKVELPELQLPRAEDMRPPRGDYAGKRSGTPWTTLTAGAIVVVLFAALWLRHSHNEHPQSQTSDAQATGAQASGAQASGPQASGARQTGSPTPQPATAPIATAQAPSSPLRSNATASSTPAATATRSTSVASTNSQPGKAGAGAASTVIVRNDVTIRTFPANQPSPSQPSNGGKSSSIAPPSNTAASTPPAVSTPAGTSSPTSPAIASSAKLSSSNKSSAAAKPLMLVIRAAETSWISVTADGQTVSQETLIAPAHASIRASHQIVARVGNAAGVSFLWNGQEIAAQGAEAEVKTYIFDAQGMREMPGQPPVPNQ